MNEGTPVLAASVKLLPVLPYIQPSLDTAQFGLAFLKQETPTENMEPGSIVSISSIEWGICSRNSRMMLLDPCGATGNTLLFLPPNCRNLLLYNKDADKHLVISTDDKGSPYVSQQTRGLLLLESLGLDLIEVFPEPKQVSLPASSKAPAKRGRKTAKAARVKQG